MNERELNLKAAMYTGMVLVAMVCVGLLLYCFPAMFVIILVGCGVFVFVSFIFLMIKIGLSGLRN
jgi:hypothetical protein